MANPNSDPFVTRVISALAMIGPVLAAVHFGSPYFLVLLALAAAILAWEWCRMCSKASVPVVWLGLGGLYVALSMWALYDMRFQENGHILIYWLFSIVWSADTGAYLLGRAIGGPKLAPSISPKKTWAGFIGGTVSAAAVGYGFSLYLASDSVLIFIVSGGILGIIAELGDLAESWVKRHFGVKDSSNLIPGHGGLMDRVDGLLPASIAAGLIAWAGQGTILTW